MAKGVREGHRSAGVSKARMQKFIEHASKKYSIPMSTLELIVKAFMEYMIESVSNDADSKTLILDAPGLENIPIVKGITVIYGHPDIGKTSLLCGMLTTIDPIYTACILDSEGKFSKRHLSYIAKRKYVAYAKEYIKSGLKELLFSGGIDVAIVDTITAIYGTSQHAFLRSLSRCVPYIICAAQTRSNIATGAPVPAVAEEAMSLAQTIVQLTEREKVIIENETCFRVYYKVRKSVEESFIGKEGSFIIQNGIYDEFLTIYDTLKNEGIIRSIGNIKYLYKPDGKEIQIGKITKVDKKAKDTIVSVYKAIRRQI